MKRVWSGACVSSWCVTRVRPDPLGAKVSASGTASNSFRVSASPDTSSLDRHLRGSGAFFTAKKGRGRWLGLAVAASCSTCKGISDVSEDIQKLSVPCTLVSLGTIRMEFLCNCTAKRPYLTNLAVGTVASAVS